MYCKPESYFFIMFSMVGRIWIRDGPQRTTGVDWSKIITTKMMTFKMTFKI